MKRIISVFLLLITLFASAHATLAWHYCGGILHSVTIANDRSGCCCGDKHGTDGDNRGCNSPNLPQITKSCCSDYLVYISTDNFDLPHFAVETVQSASNLFLLSDNTLNPIYPKNLSGSQYIFPPGGFAGYNADLLTLICIFRI